MTSFHIEKRQTILHLRTPPLLLYPTNRKEHSAQTANNLATMLNSASKWEDKWLGKHSTKPVLPRVLHMPYKDLAIIKEI